MLCLADWMIGCSRFVLVIGWLVCWDLVLILLLLVACFFCIIDLIGFSYAWMLCLVVRPGVDRWPGR